MDVKPIDILLVEDNEDHVELTIIALQNKSLINTVIVARDGQEALDYLYNKGRYQDKERYSRPDFVLLDINLPKIDGIEVLKILKNDSDLRQMPVIMLSTSESPKDIKNAYMNGANSYISKPVNFKEFKEKMHELQFYWIVTNRLIHDNS